ncbi:MAG: nickel pincer cofactor biosynthesis protein LarC [Acidobacteria bacterium]|nr:MAG: TIGR00299 family protein [Acidobacteriales bacterium 13_2_20CM_55_8]PYX03397.1 MAG: nickel pincer cofactor biosynthesis protein LarC [Acidobacteriota bacterium]
MRIAYLDCFSGMSGDMFLGALVDAGVPVHLLEETVAALNVGARLEISRVQRSGISATKVDVYVGGEKELPREVYWEQKGHNHGRDHSHPHSHDHEHVQLREHNYSQESKEPSPPAAPTSHQHEHGRGLKEIREIIRNSKIAESAKQTAIAIFETLGAAEAKIHNTDIEKIHFHEVGAVDAIVDIVCAAVGSEALAVDEFICSSLNVGGGTVKCAHGTFPVPAPATVELLKEAPVYSSGIQLELVTPTGAAIVKTLCKRFSSFPEMKIDKSGYGAGSRDLPGHANVVRLTIGEAQSEVVRKTSDETITVLEANIDDLNPQVFGYVMDRLLEEGALDAFGIPVQMKKNRPGMLLSVLCRPQDASRLTNLILSETTTLGVRRREERREVLARKLVTVSTRWGDVRLKVASMNGTITNYAPEYDDCRRIAVEHHVPLKNVMQEAMQAYMKVRAKAG